MEVYKSKNWIIEFDKENKTIHPKWFSESRDMTEQEYLNEMYKYVETVEEHKPAKAMIDLTEFYYGITPQIQEVVDKEMFPRILAAGVRRVAIIMSPDFITQLSIEQVMEEDKGKEFDTKYFASTKEAKEWLDKN